MKDIKAIFLSLSLIILGACSMDSHQRILVSAQKNDAPEQNIRRTIILEGKQLTETKPGEFISWKCRDYFDGGKVLVEAGQIPYSYLELISEDSIEINEFRNMVGFVLYDGGNTGDFAVYRRTGINKRWDWRSNGSYSFIIEPDGKGLFYDFTHTEEGEKINARNIYKCK